MKHLTKTLYLLATAALMACGGDGGESNNGGSGNDGGGNSLPTYTPSHSMAFPGADGAGRAITGGAGESVYIVTNLRDDNSDGCLRKGLRTNKSTIVFAVGGQINLTSNLEITASNITVAGQTAPGDGITIAGYPVVIKGSNVILRYLRFRMGDQNGNKANFDAESGDALGAKDVNNIMIDHCSISWSTDECASFSRIENFTLQYCIISESLRASVHTKGNHGYGGIWGGINASYHHNLLADHDSRNPRFDHHYVGGRFHGPIDYINNVVYNWGGNSTYGGEADTEENIFHINMIGNYYKPGNNTGAKSRLMQLTTHCTNCVQGSGNAYPAKIYLEGNYVNGNPATWDNVDMDGDKETRDKIQLKESAKLASQWTKGLTALIFKENAQSAYNTVLSYAGASKVRDAVDKRIIEQVKNNTGEIIDHTPEYPTLQGGSALPDTDRDGMPDDWEKNEIAKMGVKVGIDAFHPTAYNITSQFTNLEVYMNELVASTFPAGAGANKTR